MSKGILGYTLGVYGIIGFLVAFFGSRAFAVLNPTIVVVQGEVHFHHFWYGLGMVTLSGWLGISFNRVRLLRTYALIFGLGAGLIGDEIGLFLTFGNYQSELTTDFFVGVIGFIVLVPMFLQYKTIFRKDTTHEGWNERLVHLGVALFGISTIFFAIKAWTPAVLLAALGVVVVIASFEAAKAGVLAGLAAGSILAAGNFLLLYYTDPLTSLLGGESLPPDLGRKHTNSDEYFSGRIGEISELFYGNKLFTNIILLGMAFQKGLIPVSEKNLVDAIMETVSASQRNRNMEAFRLGRKLVVEPELLEFKNIVADEKILQLFGAKETYQQLLDRKSDTILHSYWMFWKGRTAAEAYRSIVQDAVSKMNLDEETNRNLARRVYDMVMWGGLDYARKYVDSVLEVFIVDRADKYYQATKTVIMNLAKVNAIKDEIYTPLLLTDEEKLERDKIRYNVDEENGDRIKYVHLNRPEFEILGKQVRFNLPQWLAHNWLMNIFKHARFTRSILTRWGWHKRELGFRDWYNDEVIGFFLKTANKSYELALRGLRVINDPYRPSEFAVTGFREVIYPKMEKARRDFEQLIGSTPPLPEIPVLAS